MDSKKRYYFDYKGRRCYAEQKIKINHSYNICGYTHKEVAEARFNFCSINSSSGMIVYWYQPQFGPGIGVTEKVFFEDILIEILDDVDGVCEQKVKETLSRSIRHTFKDEMNVDGLAQAWVLYIIAMLVSVVLNERLTAWALATAIFVRYRIKKLKEAGLR